MTEFRGNEKGANCPQSGSNRLIAGYARIMSKVLPRLIVFVACVALVGAATTLALASGGGSTSGGNASTTEYVPKPGDQGCTPGYWKNHTGSWVGYSPTDSFDAVFGVSYFKPSFTLLEALNLGGGGFNALARHAAAAILGSANPLINYGLTSSQIIALVQKAVANNDPEPIKDELAAFNEIGCPIDAHGNPSH
jgi:hypothetical protein